MIEAVERSSAAPPRGQPGDADGERAARRALLGQIERLERDLARTFADGWPREGLAAGHGGPSDRPRLRDLGELERIRDGLAARVSDARGELRARQAAERERLELVGRMLSEPERHRWVRVSHRDVGRPGCRHWHVVPRWGLLGVLGNWWRVKISSGCP